MSERIEIPPQAYLVKADFPEPPGDDLVEEILTYIMETGTPWLWWGHTHTPLPDGAIPKFIWDFHVPEFGEKRLFIAPCPHCQPSSPKYKHGVIAYFPEERVIRLMGMDCFKASNPEAFAVEQAAMTQFMNATKDRRFLQSKLPMIGDLIDVARSAQTQAAAIDEFQERLRQSVPTLIRGRFFNAMRDGVLKLRVRRKVSSVDREGTSHERDEEALEPYARVGSAALFDPAPKPLLPKLKSTITRLEAVKDTAAAHADLSTLPATERTSLVRTFGRANRDLAALFHEIDDRRSILRTDHFATLRAWTRIQNAEVDMFIDEDQQGFRIGMNREGSRSFQTPRGLRFPLPTLPNIGT